MFTFACLLIASCLRTLADIQSSPTRFPSSYGHSGASGALVRRPTDASLVEEIEAGKLSVIQEEEEGQEQEEEQTADEGDEAGTQYEGKSCICIFSSHDVLTTNPQARYPMTRLTPSRLPLGGSPSAGALRHRRSQPPPSSGAKD